MIRQKIIVSNPDENKSFKVVLLGETGAGKTSIIEKLCLKEHISCHFDCNVEIGLKELEINNKMIPIQFFNMIDNPRKNIEQYKQIVRPFFKNTSIVIIVLDLTQPDYFSSISEWIAEVETYHHLFYSNFKILCLGTKADKKPKQFFKHQSYVLSSQIASISKQFSQNIFYFEVSSQDCESCNNLLDQIKILASTVLTNNNKGFNY